MTRLTIPVTGDPQTFRPVTSSLIRKSKDGDVNIVIMLFGSHFNISMEGILQQDSNGDIEDNTKTVGTVGHELQLIAEQKVGGSTTAELIASFSSFMYFYPGTVLEGHLKLSETSHVQVVPELEVHWHYTDLLNGDALIFKLIRNELNLTFNMVEKVDGVESIIYTEELAVGETEIYYNFSFIENGKSKLFKISNYETTLQSRTRIWIGDILAKIGECNAAIHLHNAEQTLHTGSSDVMVIQYPNLFLKFDNQDIERFIGQVKMFDDLNDADEANWSQVRSRDRKFIGNRVIENGMIRIVLNTKNPDVEIWGWNWRAAIPSWEKCMTILTEADNGSKSLQIQNIKFEYFSKIQVKVIINFGTSVYSLIMNKGDPYVTLLNTGKLKFKFKSAYDRMGGDFIKTDNGYSRVNTTDGGTPINVAATGTVTCVGVLAGDTVTINGVVLTAFNGAPSSVQFDMSGNDTATALSLAAQITADTRLGIDKTGHKMSAVSVAGVVNIIDLIRGIGGNTVSLASSNGSRLAVSGALLTGGAASGGVATETLSGFTLLDNYFGVFNNADNNAIVGWMSNILKPISIKIDEVASDLEYTFTYPVKGNIFGIGVLPSFPANIVVETPTPFVIGTQDEYIKWPANEAVLSFRALETFKRR